MKHNITAILVAAVAILAGCDQRPTRVPVAGKVLINGKPLQQGYIRFVPDGARPSGSQIDETGHFRLACFDQSDGAVVGKHRVAVVSNFADVNAKKLLWFAPKKYASTKTSGLEVEVNEPTDSMIIELETSEKLPIIDSGYVQ